MSTQMRTLLPAVVVAALALATFCLAAADDDGPIKKVMQTYHKAPKGTDTVAKKASDGKASPEEIKNLAAAYKTLITAKPPKGDEASWKEKTTKLHTAALGLQKADASAVEKFKEAVNCKVCHSAHRGE